MKILTRDIYIYMYMYVANRERGPLRVGGGDRVIGVQEGMGKTDPPLFS